MALSLRLINHLSRCQLSLSRMKVSWHQLVDMHFRYKMHARDFMPTLVLAYSKEFKSSCCHCSQFQVSVKYFLFSCFPFFLSGLKPALLGKLLPRCYMSYCLTPFKPVLKYLFLSETYLAPQVILSPIYSLSILPSFFSVFYLLPSIT